MSGPSDDKLTLMRSRFAMSMAALNDSRQDELDDLKFRAGSPDNQWQWPADVLAVRGAVQGQTIGARPCLTINKLPQHVLQVTNDQRQNRPSGKVIPADDKGDIEVAEIFDGIVRHIEYISDADVAYDTACDNQVTYGEGYIRILTEYCSEDSFDQDLKIGRIRNSFSVYMDPTIQDPCGADAKFCFITQDMDKKEYEATFPNASPISTLMANGVNDEGVSAWLDQDTVRIAEYFYYETKSATLNLYPGNNTAFAGSREAKAFEANSGQPIQTRDVQRRKVMWMKTNGYEVLQEREWAGKYIPVVRVVGNEFEVEGQIYISGLVRNAKDAQRMYNYWASQEAEMLALAPKAPFIGYGGQFEGYENQWKTANTTNWPYLEVNPDAADGLGNPLPLPQRSMPPMASAGLLQAKMGAADDIKGTTGQYDASLGMQGNEKSGKAILARERQGDVGTYHYVDNLARAVRHVTRQLIDLIPKIYDTQRIARIIGAEGDVDRVKIDPTQQEPVREVKDQNGGLIEKIYNPSIGVYDVMVTTGPGYMTKRQEALEAMSTILQSNPALWSVAGDLFIKNMDWPGAQEMADRFKKILDPKVLATDEETPELAAAKQQIAALSQELNQVSTIMEHIQDSAEQQKIQIDQFKAEIQAYDAETKRIGVVSAGLTPEQVQDIVMGTLHAAMAGGDLTPPAHPQESPAMEAAEPMQETPQMEAAEPPAPMMPEPMQAAPQAASPMIEE